MHASGRRLACGAGRRVIAQSGPERRGAFFAADPRFPEQVNLYQWLGAKREKRDVCTQCPWTTACEGFQVFAQEKPDMRVERARPVAAVA